MCTREREEKRETEREKIEICMYIGSCGDQKRALKLGSGQMWLSGTKFRSSKRTANVLNPLAISQVQLYLLAFLIHKYKAEHGGQNL